MIPRHLKILLAVFGLPAGIFILTLIHAHDSSQPTEVQHWIAPGKDRTGEIQRHAPRG